MKTVFTLFLVFVASLLFTLGMFVQGILSTVISPTYLAEHSITEERVARGLNIVKEKLETDVVEKNEDLLSLSSTSQYQELTTALFDSPWVAGALRGLLRNLDIFLHSNQEPALVIDVREKKESLRYVFDRQLRDRFVLLPQCGIGTANSSLCRTKGMSYDDFVKTVSVGDKGITETINEIPDTVDLLHLEAFQAAFSEKNEANVPKTNTLESGFLRARELYRYAVTVIPIFFGVAFLCCLGIVLLHRTSARSVGAWMSTLMIYSGVLSLVVASVVSQLVPNLFLQFINEQKGLPADLPSLLEDLVRQLTHDAVFTMQIIAGLITALGVCLVIIVCIERPKKEGPTIIRH